MNGKLNLPLVLKLRLKSAALRYLAALLFLLTCVFLISTSGSVFSQEQDPIIAVFVNQNHVGGFQWPEGTPVTVAIDDPGTPDNPDYTDTQTAVADEGGTSVGFSLGELFTIQPGCVVTMTDGLTTKVHTVTSLTVTAADMDTDTIWGTAVPGTLVQIDLQGGSPIYRSEIVDAGGNWLADFSVPGDEPGEDIYDIDQSSVLMVMQNDDDGDHTQIDWQAPNPTFAARADGDNINGWEWTANGQVTITLDSDPTFTAPTDESGYFDFNLNGAYDIVPGTHIVVTDGVSTKDHFVTPLAITNVDVDTEIVTGVATPDAQVNVWICWEDNCANRWEIADGSGAWMTDFSVPGDEAGEELTADISPGTWVDSGEGDDDGDNTNAGYNVPNPYLEAQPQNDWVNGRQWDDGAVITLSIDDPAIPGAPDYTDSQIAYIPDWDPSQTAVEFNLQGVFDLKAGDIAVMSDGTITKTHVVANLSAVNYDLDADTISGVADPDLLFDIWAHDDCCWNLQVQADAAGNWTADLSQFGYDLQPGSDGAMGWSDDDGDNTWVGWHVNNPTFAVRTDGDNVNGWEWQANDQVTITLDYGPSFTAPTDEWGYFDIHLEGAYDIVPGTYVEVTDGVIVKDHTVTNLTITAVDVDADTVTGTASPGGQVQVWTDCWEEGCVNRSATADGNGDWSVDFSVPGGESEEQTADIQPGSWVDSGEWDDDGDNTNFGLNVPNPNFAVHLFDAQVEGWEWPLGADVTMTIDDPATPQNPDYTDTQTVVVADWDPSQTDVRFDFNYVYFIAPGHIVTLSDGVTTKTHTVIDLGITDVNEDADTVSGTAVPDSQVDAWICDDWGCANRHVLADPTGSWLADFANPGPQDDEQDTYDIVPGTRGDVSQSDDDGDSTQIWWDVSNPRLEVSYEHDWININGFSADGQVTYTIYDYEGGHALFGPVTGPVDPHGDGWISQNLFHTDLVPGMFVTAVDETTGEEISLLIQDVNLDYVGIDDDRAFGTAVPNTTIELHISENHDSGFQLTIPVDSNGDWEADLAAAGYPINEYRHADARLYDAEGDSITAQPPRLHAEVRTDNINVDNFSKNADVTFTLYDSPGGAILYGPEILHTDSSGNAGVNLWEYGIDLQVGHTFVAYDHTLDFTKTLEIELFTFDEMNTADDTVQGTSYADEWVDLHVESLFSNWGRDALTDGTGHWFADYASDGYDITEQMWASGWAVDNQGNWSQDHITGFPNIEASPRDDWINGWNFTPDRPVHVQIYDAEGGSLLAEVETMADGNTQFNVNYDQHGIDLQAGMYILVTDTETGKTASLTLAFLTFDAVDYDADTAVGQADPGVQVVVSADWLFDHFETTVTADPSGNWFADFAALGADLTPDWGIQAKVYDAELDATVANAPQPPHFTASLNEDWINGDGWTGGAAVQISVYEFDGGPLILLPLDWETDPQGSFYANLWEQDVDLQPGFYIVVHDTASGQEKTLTLSDLSIEFVDYDQDTVGGLAPPDTRLIVGFGNDQDYLEFDLFSEGDGSWLADFGLHNFDLLPGMGGSARIDDDDGDTTRFDTHNSQPTIWARPHEERVEAVDFQLGATVEMEVYDASDPTQTIIFSDQALVEPAPEFIGPETLAVFEFQDVFDLLPGHVVRVSDGQTTKEVFITPLAITDIDAEADTIYGIAEPFSAVNLEIWADCCFNTQVFADENGNWMVDLGGMYDLDTGTRGGVYQQDEDGDRVEHHFEIEAPPFPCEPGDTVSGRVTLGDGITPLTSATVTFEDFDTGETLFFVEADMNGYYSCYLPDGDYRIWAVGDMYSREYYEETIFENATAVPVTEGAQFTDVNFTLDTPFFIWEHLTFNLDDPVTGDIAVRQAIAFGSDRAAMIEAAFPASPMLDSYLPPDHWAYTGEGLMQYDFNPDLARTILEQAGWVDEDGDGIRERDGQRLHILYVTTDAEHRVEITNIFAANMADIGVEVEVWADPNPWSRIFDDHDFSVAQFAWASDYNSEMEGDPWQLFLCDDYSNPGSYCNQTADQMLNLLELFGTRAEIIPFLAQHQQIVMADLAVLPLMLRVEEEPSPLNTFVVLGQEGVYLKHGGTVVSGDVGANTAVPGPYLSDDAEVVIGTHVTFLNATSRLMGDSVRVKEDAQVYDVYYNTLDLDGNTVIQGMSYSPLDLPIVAAFPEVPDFTPGTQDFDVPKNESLTLDAGSYGLLKANKGATIVFTGGVYNFAEWDIEKDVNLFFEAPSEVRVAGKVKMDKNCYLGPAPGAEGVGAPDIVFYILGVNGDDGSLDDSPKAAVVGKDNTIIANIYAPNGTLHIRKGTDATGAFLGKWVLIGNDVALTLASGW